MFTRFRKSWKYINAIQNDGNNLSNLTIYATGGSYSIRDDKTLKNYTLASRNYVEETLKKYFSKDQLTIKWSKKDTTTELYLNTKTGKFILETILDQDLIIGNYLTTSFLDELEDDLP